MRFSLREVVERLERAAEEGALCELTPGEACEVARRLRLRPHKAVPLAGPVGCFDEGRVPRGLPSPPRRPR